ncbi:uncharacterized protein LOC144088983 [Stigmatopora argus]
MANRLRLDFASRRSHTDPLSDCFSNHAEESGVILSGGTPKESLAHSSLHFKVTSLSPDYGNSQRYSSVFIPRVNKGACSQKSVVQISLHPRGVLSGDADGDTGSGEVGAVAGSDGSSCSSSMASDAGYWSSNSIFEPDTPEKHRNTQEKRVLLCRESKVPLRRCSSLVIFPKSPCSTPPSSPVHPVARAPFQSPPADSLWNDEEFNWKDSATATSGQHGLKGNPPSEGRDAKHMVHFNIPFQDNPKCNAADNSHSRSILLHFAKKPVATGKLSEVCVDYPDAPYPVVEPETTCDPKKKLYRSTSACLFSSVKPPEEKPSEKAQERFEENHCHRAIQRSFSLEVPYANTGISCHVSNKKLGSTYSPHVHIHLSPFCPTKLPSLSNDADKNNDGDSTEKSLSGKFKVSFFG